jgi:hypothetical protein
VGELWRCPRCGQTFVSPNLPHSCLVADLDELVAPARELFDLLRAAIEENGPVTVNATRSRATFQTRMRFAAVERTRSPVLRGHVVLTRPVSSPRVERVEFLPPSYYLHRFRLRAPEDVDDELRALLREAYGVGEQRHLTDPSWPRVTEPPDWVTRAGG